MTSHEQLFDWVQRSRVAFDNLPGFFYVKTIDSQYMYCSHEVATALKISIQDLVGRTDDNLPWALFGREYQQQDKNAMANGLSDVLQPVPLGKKRVLATRCIKHPILDDTNKIMGVFGRVDILAKSRELSEALSLLQVVSQDKFNTKTYYFEEYEKALRLTARESECLFLLIRGYATKAIASFLEISPRTVETHLEHIKEKLGVFSRSQMIDKAIELGMVDIIPKSSILLSLFKNSKKWRYFLKSDLIY